jgi:hypothetical protein
MDIETSRSMRLTMLATAASFVMSIIAYIRVLAFSPITAYPEYDNFIRYLIVAMMVQFIVLPVLLAFFVNDSGELENFTKEGPMEKAWLVNTIGVVIMIVAGIILGLALADTYTGWNPPADLGAVFGGAIIKMTWAMFIQALGFSVPVFYFLLSKRFAKGIIPFKKDELTSDALGIIFSIMFVFPPAMLVVSPVFGTTAAGMFGIFANVIGVAWTITYFLAIKKRQLPDIPEDNDR